MDVINIHNLSISFGDKDVLAIEALNIESGIITVITGASGSGKTTLLRAINRLNECFDDCVTSGEILLFGKSVYDYPLEELRRGAGMVFQHPNVFPVSIERNFLVPLVYGMKVDAKRAKAIMEEKLKLVGLWAEVKDRLSVSAESLSGGQKQRLCIARALALGPKILLLDEPTSSLDAKAAAVIEEYIQRISGAVTVVLVTHSMAQAEKLGGAFVEMVAL